MKNKGKRPGKCRAHCSRIKTWMCVLAIFMAICLVAVPVICLAGSQKEMEREEWRRD